MRAIGALVVALRGFLLTLWRVTRQLFHETAGALFVVFAAVGAASAWRAWQGNSPEWLIGLSIGFTLMMAGFAVASFRSARRVR